MKPLDSANQYNSICVNVAIANVELISCIDLSASCITTRLHNTPRYPSTIANL